MVLPRRTVGMDYYRVRFFFCEFRVRYLKSSLLDISFRGTFELAREFKMSCYVLLKTIYGVVWSSECMSHVSTHHGFISLQVLKFLSRHIELVWQYYFLYNL
jgi:hypothetical protein